MLLSAVERRLPDGSYQSIDRPLTALRDSTLLVNAPGEPRVLHELIAEVPSAHSIDVLVAFVRLSGIAPMLTALRRHLENGGRVRLLTTTYTNSTQVEALEALTNAGADVRVSYDQTTTRLHAKAWIFNRAPGSRRPTSDRRTSPTARRSPGLEWNVRLSSRPETATSSTRWPPSSRPTGQAATSSRSRRRSSVSARLDRTIDRRLPFPRPTSPPPVPRTNAGAHRRRPRPRPSPQPAGRGDRHRQDRHGRRRLPQPHPQLPRARLLFVAHRARDPRPEPPDLPPRAARRVLR